MVDAALTNYILTSLLVFKHLRHVVLASMGHMLERIANTWSSLEHLSLATHTLHTPSSAHPLAIFPFQSLAPFSKHCPHLASTGHLFLRVALLVSNTKFEPSDQTALWPRWKTSLLSELKNRRFLQYLGALMHGTVV